MYSARRRLLREFITINNEPSTYYTITHNPQNIQECMANIHCLPGYRYDGMNFNIELTIPDTYPFRPPELKFLSPIKSQHVDSKTGRMCLDILNERWSPAMTLSQLITSICSILTDGQGTRYSSRLHPLL